MDQNRLRQLAGMQPLNEAEVVGSAPDTNDVIRYVRDQVIDYFDSNDAEITVRQLQQMDREEASNHIRQIVIEQLEQLQEQIAKQAHEATVLALLGDQ